MRRSDISQVGWTARVLPELQDDQVLLEIDRFGFSANNVTYAARGEGLFWKFFPAPDGWFRTPVWGFANVVASRRDGVAAGERLYGYLPMSSHLLMDVGEVTDTGFTAVDPHRRDLPAIYNLYHRTAADPAYRADREAEQALLRPVFRTSFVIDDYLADNRFFGADQIIFGSASSKTAMASAFVMSRRRRAGVRVVGLTARRNLPFLRGVGYFDEVHAYDDVSALDRGRSSAYVDMSGDAAIRQAVHARLGEALVFDARVGSTHWAKMDDRPVDGVQPTIFSMADQMRKRMADWGPDAFQRRISDDWRAFLDSAAEWLKPVESRGEAAVERVYRAMIAGRSDPDIGHILSVRP